MRVLVVGNPKAHGGRAKRQFDDYQQFLKLQSAIEFDSYLTKQSFDEVGIASAIKAFDPQIISIIGGDGTVNDVINVDEARKCELHLIPAGSGNDFSTLINGKLSEQSAFELIKSPRRKTCDTGICNGRYFLNGVGIGFDGSVARQTVFMKLPFSTSWKYWIAILKHVLFYKSSKMQLKYNGQVIEDEYFMLSIANGTEYGGGFRVSPLSDPQDGLLNLVAIKKINPLVRLKYIPVIEKGKHLGLNIVEHVPLTSINVKSNQLLYAHLDGELMSGNEFKIKVAEKVQLLSIR